MLRAALLLTILALGRPAAAGDQLSTVVGTYVLASGDVAVEVLEEAARLGDQLVPRLESLFEAELPVAQRPLRVRVHATREDFEAAVRAEGATEDLAAMGGFTPRQTLVSHVLQRPYAFDTRRLVLHELVHQVQDRLFRDRGAGTDLEWHREGLAEHFGWHVREARELRTGALDALAHNRQPWLAARLAASGAFDAWAVGTGARPASYVEAQCLFEALHGAQDPALREAFRSWQREAWRRRDARERFEALLGAHRVALEAQVRAFWAAQPHPWRVVSGDWDQQDAQVVGRSPQEDVFAALQAGHASDADDDGLLPPGQRGGVGARASARLRPSTAQAGVALTLVRRGEVRLLRRGEDVELRLRPGAEPSPLLAWKVPSAADDPVDLSLMLRADGAYAAVAAPGFSASRLVPWADLPRGDGDPTDVGRGVEPRLVVAGGRQEFGSVVLVR